MIYQKRRPRVVGLDIPVDLGVLVGDVYVGPKATPLEFNAVAAVMRDAGLAGKPVKSALVVRPKKKGTPYIRSVALQEAVARAKPRDSA